MRNLILLLVLMCVINVWANMFVNIPESSTNELYTDFGKIKGYYKFPKHGIMPLLKQSNHSIPQPFKISLSEHKIKQMNNFKDANIIFFNLLVDYRRNYDRLFKNIKHQNYIYSLLCVDTFANKAYLYSMFQKNASESEVFKYLPVTYILDNKQSYNKLINEYDPDKLYILKKNVQRQKGCTITNNEAYIKQAHKNNYVVCQEVLLDPYTIQGHKINIRQYMLVIVRKSDCEFLLFNDGFLYYTPKKFIKGSLDKQRHITTGYIDRKIYEDNPMTLKELYDYMGKTDSFVLEKNIVRLFKSVANVYMDHVLENDTNLHVNFMIFGCDVAVSNTLDCKIMEINKGPDLSFKDKRDGAVKHTLGLNTLHEVGIINAPHNNFIPLSYKYKNEA